MLHHLSLDAEDPARAAAVFAELLGGEALPFPPVTDEAWIVLTGDAHGTAIEFYPAGTELVEGAGAADSFGVAGPARRRSATHFAIGTALSVEAVRAIAAREGWPAKICSRGGMFDVIELWIEGARMVELLTPAMQARYVETLTIANWRALLAQERERLAA